MNTKQDSVIFSQMPEKMAVNFKTFCAVHNRIRGEIPMLILSLLLLALVAFKLYGYLFIDGHLTKGVFDLQFDKRKNTNLS
jgi:hypothetical protein